LLTYNSASVYAYQQQIPLRVAKDYMNQVFAARVEAETDLDIDNPAQVAALKRAVAMQVLLSHPLQTVWVHILDSTQLLRPGYSQMNLILEDDAQQFGNSTNTGRLPHPRELTEVQRGIFAYMTLYYAALFILTFLGAGLILWRKNWFVSCLLILLPYWFAFIPSIAGNSRFRVPIEGFVALLTMVAVQFLWDFVQHRVRKIRFYDKES